MLTLSKVVQLCSRWPFACLAKFGANIYKPLVMYWILFYFQNHNRRSSWVLNKFKKTSIQFSKFSSWISNKLKISFASGLQNGICILRASELAEALFYQISLRSHELLQRNGDFIIFLMFKITSIYHHGLLKMKFQELMGFRVGVSVILPNFIAIAWTVAQKWPF